MPPLSTEPALIRLGVSVLVSVLVPVNVSTPFRPIVPVLFNANSPEEPEALIVPPAVVTVNKRSTFAPPPVYSNVPPLSTRFAALLLAAPMSLAEPPLASALTLNAPPFEGRDAGVAVGTAGQRERAAAALAQAAAAADDVSGAVRDRYKVKALLLIVAFVGVMMPLSVTFPVPPAVSSISE